MTIARPASYDGFQGKAVKIKMTEDPVGMRYCGPGSWKEDRLLIYARKGKVKAEREFIGKKYERIVVSTEVRISQQKALELIDWILEPYREPYEITDIWDTDMKIYDENGKKYTLKGGCIEEVLEELEFDHWWTDYFDISQR